MTRCPVCNLPLTRDRDSLELVCRDCSQAEAERLYAEATAEAAALAYRMDADTMPKYSEPFWIDNEPPF